MILTWWRKQTDVSQSLLITILASLWALASVRGPASKDKIENKNRRHPASPSCLPRAGIRTYPHAHTQHVHAHTLTFKLIYKIWSCVLGVSVLQSLHVAIKPPISLSLPNVCGIMGTIVGAWLQFGPFPFMNVSIFTQGWNERMILECPFKFQPHVCLVNWHCLHTEFQ